MTWDRAPTMLAAKCTRLRQANAGGGEVGLWGKLQALLGDMGSEHASVRPGVSVLGGTPSANFCPDA